MRRVCRIHFCIGEYIFCIGGMLEKNYLKFSQVFTFFHFFCKFLQKNSGVPDAAGLSDTFLVLEILVEKKYSQIFSNFLGIHFYVLAMAENYLKFSQIFSNYLQIILQIISGVPDAAGLSDKFFSIGNFGGKKIVSIFSTKYLPQIHGVHVSAMGGTGREWLSDTIFVLVAYREKL